MTRHRGLMARSEHLPNYRQAYDLRLHTEKIVRSFSRYSKYTLRTDLRTQMLGVLETIVQANSTPAKTESLLRLRGQLENLRVLSRKYMITALPKGVKR